MSSTGKGSGSNNTCTCPPRRSASAELWSTVPVVFGSVDEATVARLNLPPDVTETIWRLRLGNIVTAARALVPNLKKIALVGDPFERQPFRRHFTQELSEFAK